jgi:hypothetical protein
MKSQSPNITAVTFRCSHRAASGRQCRQLSADSCSGLCAHHRDLQKQKETDDLSHELLARCQNFQTAQGVNFALANIYRLLATNRISPRRASVLAYVNSLLLRTLPAIDYDHENGHTDPTVPEPNETEADETEADEIEGDFSEPIDAKPSTTYASPSHLSASDAVWGPSDPEPDPAKKPS